MNWRKIKWPYNSEKPYSEWDCYKAKIGRFTVILYPGLWPSTGWSYVVKGEYSGFLKGHVDLTSAKIAVVNEVKRMLF